MHKRGGKGSPRGNGKIVLPGPALDSLLAAEKGKTGPEDVFRMMREFQAEKRAYLETLKRAQGKIEELYQGFTPEERARFFTMIYDLFSDTYDQHMGVDTMHFFAMRRVLRYVSDYLCYPMIDLTAGTAELMKYALEFSELGGEMVVAGDYERYGPLVSDLPAERMLQKTESGLVYVNEISPKMLEKAREKLEGYDVVYSSYNACDPPPELHGRFRTVLISQTFHLISDEDKQRLVDSVYRVLVPGGNAIVVEEDRFKITDTASIGDAELCIRAVAQPIRLDDLIGRFEVSGFYYHEVDAGCPIDPEKEKDRHSMRVHMFRRN